MIASFKYRREVRFAETDAFGFAYFDTYIRMMEETEYAFLRSRGLRVVLNDEKGVIGFPRLQANIDIQTMLRFQDIASITLQLVEIDGKQIVYEFRLEHDHKVVVVGCFKVACCRFPENDIPYAILTPEHVIEKLTSAG